MLWNFDGKFTWFEILPWFERSTGWGSKNRYEERYHRTYTIEWLGYKLEIIKEISKEKWIKIHRRK